MIDSAFANPSQRLMDSRFDDVEVSHHYAEDSGLFKSFRRLLNRKRIFIASSIVLSILLIISLTLTGVFVARAKNAKSFRNNLENHVKSDFKAIDRKLLDSYVKELSKLYEEREISYDHVREFDALLNFERFNRDYKRVHASDGERKTKFLTFRTKYFATKTHRGHETYSKEINAFADMSDEEFKRLFPPIKLSLKPSSKEHVDSLLSSRKLNPNYLTALGIAKNTSKPVVNANSVSGEGIDWRRAGGVTKVKDQGLCGSCWAFATIGSVESLYKIHEGRTLDLSEQELVNCDKKSNGCNGGFGDTALNYIKTKGVSHTADMPYHAIDQDCTVKTLDKVFINSFAVTNGEDILNKSLVLSPTIVYIAASNELTMYKSGVFNGECATDLNHAVLLVGEGYDELVGKRYWIIKNSWGPYWGEDGYFRLERTKKGADMCGVLTIGLNPSL